MLQIKSETLKKLLLLAVILILGNSIPSIYHMRVFTEIN